MAQVRAHCPRCEVVEVPCPAVTVVRRAWESEAEYHLACPHCGGVVRGLLRPTTAMQLVAAGSRLLEVDDGVSRPLTEDEIDDFAASLDEPGALERELAALRTPR
jgi:hypothetical protein